jgi:hypothetical protein
MLWHSACCNPNATVLCQHTQPLYQHMDLDFFTDYNRGHTGPYLKLPDQVQTHGASSWWQQQQQQAAAVETATAAASRIRRATHNLG